MKRRVLITCICTIYIAAVSGLLRVNPITSGFARSAVLVKASSCRTARLQAAVLPLPSVSLDRPLLPVASTTFSAKPVILTAAAFVLLANLMRICYPLLLRFIDGIANEEPTSTNTDAVNGVISSTSPVVNVLSGLQHKLIHWMKAAAPSNFWRKARSESLPIHDWTIASLADISDIDQDWTKYRFELEGYSNSVVDIQVGQQVSATHITTSILCLTACLSVVGCAVPSECPRPQHKEELLLRSAAVVSRVRRNSGPQQGRVGFSRQHRCRRGSEVPVRG
jgi:hypothetical protein